MTQALVRYTEYSPLTPTGRPAIKRIVGEVVSGEAFYRNFHTTNGEVYATCRLHEDAALAKEQLVAFYAAHLWFCVKTLLSDLGFIVFIVMRNLVRAYLARVSK